MITSSSSSRRRPRGALLLLVAASLLLTALGLPPSRALAAPAADRRPASGATPAADVPAGRRDDVLGKGWRASGDRVVAAAGDSAGLHLYRADARAGYAWQPLATLAEPGFDTDRWIGNLCVDGAGTAAVVVYAPRTFTNRDELFARGGFVALVDLRTAAVTKLDVQASLAYFDPSCGAGHRAVLTQAGGEHRLQTRLVTVDTASRRVVSRVTVQGQLTSAVPTAAGIVGADAGTLVRVDATGTRHALVGTSGTAYKLAADRDGGVTYLERSGTNATARRIGVTTGRVASAPVVARGAVTDLDVAAGRGGRVFVVGHPAATATPRSRAVTLLRGDVGSAPSLDGSLLVSPPVLRPAAAASASAELRVSARATATGRAVSFRVPVATVDGAATATMSPALQRVARPARRTQLSPQVAGTPSTSPADLADRTCSVPRNDPANQAMQPKPRQVEWAIDQAVRGALTVSRPANWKNLGMPAYTPQGLFPSLALTGGGYVPAQIMLGVAAQESNLWEAARYAVPGVTGNPLIGNYFGLPIYNDTSADDWSIDWSAADCGYGVTQVTDGMRLYGKTKPGETALPYQTQRAVALDFAANVAAGLRILQQKWNETRAAGLVVNNGDSSKIENWFFAVWAYNSGFHAKADASSNGGAWGVGWGNNPANPNYPANRTPFMRSGDDASHPQDWPYPEKVMGWAAYPPTLLESPDTEVVGFRQAFWNGTATTAPINRDNVKPPVNQFCDTSDSCQPGKKYTPNAPDVIGEPAGPCAHTSSGLYDLRCWYNKPTTWKSDCATTCGNELLRFDPGYAYQEDGTAYPPVCTLTGLPSNALVVDDVPDGTASVRPNCGRPWTNAGSFAFSFPPDSTGHYPGKIDTHQLGAGFGGHFWFTHTRQANDAGGVLGMTGTWTASASRTGPMKVLVALPDVGAQTREASYTVKTANGDRTRRIRQGGSGNRWVSLGAFQFNGKPQVTLSNVTADGEGEDDIAFDAVAFVPIAGTYHEETLEADALFDENQNIDTDAPGWLAGNLKDRKTLYDWAANSTAAIQSAPTTCTSTNLACTGPATRAAIDSWRNEVLLSGYDPVNHPVGHSIARWIGFSNAAADRPTSNTRPASFDDDSRYKIRSKMTVSFVAGSDGKVIDGSEWAEYTNRTADTHLPQFVRDFIAAVKSDYGVAVPDLRYSMVDANLHNGHTTKVDPLSNGVLPGRAYAYAGIAPTVAGTAGTSGSGNTCVAANYVSGGSIGYRTMLASDGPAEAMTTWADALGHNVKIPSSVALLGSDIRDMFFRNGDIIVNASSFAHAPPIWQELSANFCSDGTIHKADGRDYLRASFMPDQYLYRNGVAMTLNGTTTTSTAPVMTGDFGSFSHADITSLDFPAYHLCSTISGRKGNPWSIDPGDGPDDNAPHATLCSYEPNDPAHSW